MLDGQLILTASRTGTHSDLFLKTKRPPLVRKTERSF